MKGDDFYDDGPSREARVKLQHEIFSVLNPEQQADFLFLASGLMRGIPLTQRLAILERLKENGGNITLAEIVSLGVTDATERSYGELLSAEYRFTRFGETFYTLDAQMRREQQDKALFVSAGLIGGIVKFGLEGPSNITFGSGKLDNTESKGTLEGFKGSRGAYVPGVGGQLFDSLDDYIVNPKKLANSTPEQLYHYLQSKGYDPQPLSNGSLARKPFTEGGGYIIRWGGDHALEYHPGGINHHGNRPYFRISSGATGKMWFDLSGDPLQ
jgi:hypothetical protein